jgi:hypothetical protein
MDGLLDTNSSSKYDGPAAGSDIVSISADLNDSCGDDFVLDLTTFLLLTDGCFAPVLLRSWSDVMFTFGMSLSRSEQMTQNAWERRWTSQEQRDVGNRQFKVDVDDAKRLSVFILQQSKDRIDIPTRVKGAPGPRYCPAALRQVPGRVLLI